MFKKLLVSSVVLAVSSTAFAGNYKGEGNYKDAAPCPTYQYMTGPYLGLSAGVRDNIAGTPAAYKGFEGTLSAGYGALLTPVFYLAGEIFVGDSAQMKNYEAQDGTSVKTSWTYGASIIPGYMITDHVLGYVRLGAVNSRFTGPGTNKSAWQVGVGGQTNLWDNWDLRGEYVYSGYGDVNPIGKPAADQFNIGIVYKFV